MVDLLRQHPLYKKTGNELKQVNANEVLTGINMMAYYFGAKYCSDCVKFTPILKEFYNKMKANKESFEIVYVSSDKTEEEMKEFVLESHGDWLVFHMDESNENSKSFEAVWNFRELFAITGIPAMTVTKREDEELCTMDGITDLLTQGDDAYKDWKRKREFFLMGREREDDPPRIEGKINPNCCKISRFKPWTPKSPKEILTGRKLFRKAGENLVEEPAEESLAKADIVAFYFSTSRCGPCHVFTPELKRCFDKLKAEKKPFEVVYVSGDESEEDMRNFMMKLHGDWLTVAYGDATDGYFCKTFAINSVPTVRIINKQGELVSKNGLRDVRVKGAKSFPFWMEGKSAATKEEEDKFWEQGGFDEDDE